MFKNYFTTLAMFKEVEKNPMNHLGQGSNLSVILLLAPAFTAEGVDGKPQIYKVTDETVPMLVNTRNQIFPRLMPFRTMFLELKLETKELEVMGIILDMTSMDLESGLKRKKIGESIFDGYMEKYITIAGAPKGNDGKALSPDHWEDPRIIQDWMKGFYRWLETQKLEEVEDKEYAMPTAEELIKKKAWGVLCFAWGIDKTDGTMFTSWKQIGFKERNEKLRKAVPKEAPYVTDFDMTSVDAFSKGLELFACNFLDLVNNPEVVIVAREEDKAHNVKRLHRKQLPIPAHKFVRLTGTLHRHAIKSQKAQQGSKLTHRYWVAGHFMRFWDLERFRRLYSEWEAKVIDKRYYFDEVNKVLMTWVFPHIKGEGLLVESVRVVGKQKTRDVAEKIRGI